jgi:hypothetical protein
MKGACIWHDAGEADFAEGAVARAVTTRDRRRKILANSRSPFRPLVQRGLATLSGVNFTRCVEQRPPDRFYCRDISLFQCLDQARRLLAHPTRKFIG